MLLTVDLERLDVRAGDLVLDAGCGEGRHCFGCLERGARVVGLDLDFPSLRDASKRTGAYNEYIRGSLSNYSLSLHRYWSDGRNNPGSNLRRNTGFHLLNQALPDPCLEAQRTYHLEFVKKGARLTLKVDGTVVHDTVDTGEHGPVLGEGKIGFRLRGDSSCVMTLDSIRLWRLASCGTADSADP